MRKINNWSELKGIQNKNSEGENTEPRTQSLEHLDLFPLWNHGFLWGVVETQSIYFFRALQAIIIHCPRLAAGQENFQEIRICCFGYWDLQHVLEDLNYTFNCIFFVFMYFEWFYLKIQILIYTLKKQLLFLSGEENLKLWPQTFTGVKM